MKKIWKLPIFRKSADDDRTLRQFGIELLIRCYWSALFCTFVGSIGYVFLRVPFDSEHWNLIYSESADVVPSFAAEPVRATQMSPVQQATYWLQKTEGLTETSDVTSEQLAGAAMLLMTEDNRFRSTFDVEKWVLGDTLFSPTFDFEDAKRTRLKRCAVPALQLINEAVQRSPDNSEFWRIKATVMLMAEPFAPVNAEDWEHFIRQAKRVDFGNGYYELCFAAVLLERSDLEWKALQSEGIWVETFKVYDPVAYDRALVATEQFLSAEHIIVPTHAQEFSLAFAKTILPEPLAVRSAVMATPSLASFLAIKSIYQCLMSEVANARISGDPEYVVYVIDQLSRLGQMTKNQAALEFKMISGVCFAGATWAARLVEETVPELNHQRQQKMAKRYRDAKLAERVAAAVNGSLEVTFGLPKNKQDTQIRESVRYVMTGLFFLFCATLLMVFGYKLVSNRRQQHVTCSLLLIGTLSFVVSIIPAAIAKKPEPNPYVFATTTGATKSIEWVMRFLRWSVNQGPVIWLVAFALLAVAVPCCRAALDRQNKHKIKQAVGSCCLLFSAALWTIGFLVTSFGCGTLPKNVENTAAVQKYSELIIDIDQYYAQRDKLEQRVRSDKLKMASLTRLTNQSPTRSFEDFFLRH